MARRYYYETTLCVDGENDLDVKVSFTVTWGHPGCWYQRNGDPGFPPEPSEVDDIRVETIGGKKAPWALHSYGDLDDKMTAEAIVDKLYDEHNDAMIASAAEEREADRWEAAEARREELRDRALTEGR